jgi:uncharacterized protein (DUF4213/DUF364 family)
MIIEKTVELVKEIYKYHKITLPKVTKVVIGLGYTGVEVTAYSYKPFLGLAYTLPNIINSVDCSKIIFAGNLTTKPLIELLQWAYEPPNLKKIIGIATLNAISQHIFELAKDNDWGNPYIKIKSNLIDSLKINNNSKVIFIGLIKPLIQEVAKLTKNIIIIEDNPLKREAFEKIPIKKNAKQLGEDEIKTDILFCTGTSLINDSIEEILEIFKKRVNSILLIGPSASLLPDILFENGVSIVGGIKIFDSEATLRILQEGGGTKLFKRYGKKYNLIHK